MRGAAARLVLAAVAAAGLAQAMGGTVRGDAPAGTTLLDERGRQPRVAIGADGTVAVVYGLGSDIYCRVSRDRGATYGEPVRVATVAGLHLGMGRGPQVAVVADGLVVAAIGKAGDILAWRSGDAGRSWNGPAQVNGAPRSAEEGLLSLAAGGDSVHAVWLDLRRKKSEVYVAKSQDKGATWTERSLDPARDGAVCECCLPTVAADAEGGVAVMFRNQRDGARDMYAAVSRDGGGAFAEATKLGSGTWPLDGCPMDGGGVALRGPRLLSIWRREKLLYASSGPGIEIRLGEGKNPVIALAATGAIEAWEDAGAIRLHRTSTAGAEVVGPGSAPSLGAAPGGALVLLAWERPAGGVLAAAVQP